jgi:hypothetical protein
MPKEEYALAGAGWPSRSGRGLGSICSVPRVELLILEGLRCKTTTTYHCCFSINLAFYVCSKFS